MKRKLCLLFFTYFLLSLSAMTNAIAGNQENSTINVPSSTLPQPLEVYCRFMDGYKAELKLKNNGTRYIFDLQKNKKKYDRSGLYLHSRLNEPTELVVHPFSSLGPVLMNGSVSGYRGIQKITGIDEKDIIATIESNWICNRGEWSLVSVKVMEGLD